MADLAVTGGPGIKEPVAPAEQPANPPRRHRVASVVVATLGALGAMLAAVTVVAVAKVPYRGVDLVCWGHDDPAACHARADVMIDWFARSHPHLAPVLVQVGRDDQLCSRGDDETACIALD